MVDHNDPILNRAVESLRELPPIDHAAIARITAAAAQARARDVGDNDAEDLFPAYRSRYTSLRATIGIAAAAAFIGFFARDIVVRQNDRTAVAPRSADGLPAATTPDNAPILSVGDARGAEQAPIPTQFVLERKGAKRVTVVGDFNGWGEGARVELQHEPGTSLWTTTVPLTPGRHLYAFVVDDSVWTPDPRAPRAKDADFGVAGSVVIVGRP